MSHWFDGAKGDIFGRVDLLNIELVLDYLGRELIRGKFSFEDTLWQGQLNWIACVSLV